MAQLTPAELAARRKRPVRVSGAALGNPRVAELLLAHYPEFVTPARVSQKALHDKRVIALLSEHYPELIVRSPEPLIDTAGLRARRIGTGLTAAQFASEVGLTPDAYRNAELGHKGLSAEKRALVAARLGIDPADLLTASAA